MNPPRTPLSASPEAPEQPSAATPRRWLLGTTLACLGMAILDVLPLLGLDGWPDNHERLSIFERAEGFRRAYAAGDFFPLWTPFCFNGHGSPWPFFYHRLFSTVSGGLAWVLDSAYRGVQLAVVLVLFVGATGAAAAARRLGASSLIQVLAALLLLLSPYTFFDWLVRGATAESTSMMLYPWLLWACLRLLSTGRGGLAVGLLAVLLFYAHTVMFLFALPTVVLVLGFVLERWGWRPALVAAGLSALPVLVLCAPYAVLLMRLEKSFNTAELGRFTPDREFLPLRSYFWDTAFHWGQHWGGITPEVGPALLASLLVLALVALTSRGGRPRGWGSTLVLLAVPTGLYGLLQAPFTAAFYRSVPLAPLLQFPWRLVGFITVLLVLLWSLLAQDAWRRGGWRRGIALTAMVLPAVAGLRFGWTALHPHYDVVRRAVIDRQLAALDRPWSASEYLPRSMAGRFLAPPMPFIFQRDCARMTAEPAPALERPLHFQRITLSVSSAGGCTVYSNQFQTPFLTVESSGPVRAFTTPEGTLGIQVPPGEHRVELRRRGFLELLVQQFTPAS